MEDLKKLKINVARARKAVSSSLEYAKSLKDDLLNKMTKDELKAYNDFEKRYLAARDKGDEFLAGKIVKEFKKKHG